MVRKKKSDPTTTPPAVAEEEDITQPSSRLPSPPPLSTTPPPPTNLRPRSRAASISRSMNPTNTRSTSGGVAITTVAVTTDENLDNISPSSSKTTSKILGSKRTRRAPVAIEETYIPPSRLEGREKRLQRLQASEPELAARYQSGSVQFLTVALRSGAVSRTKKGGRINSGTAADDEHTSPPSVAVVAEEEEEDANEVEVDVSSPPTNNGDITPSVVGDEQVDYQNINADACDEESPSTKGRRVAVSEEPEVDSISPSVVVTTTTTADRPLPTADDDEVVNIHVKGDVSPLPPQVDTLPQTEETVEVVEKSQDVVVVAEEDAEKGTADEENVNTSTANVQPTMSVEKAILVPHRDKSTSSSSSSSDGDIAFQEANNEGDAKVKELLRKRASRYNSREVGQQGGAHVILTRAERMRRALESTNPELLQSVESGNIRYLTALSTIQQQQQQEGAAGASSPRRSGGGGGGSSTSPVPPASVEESMTSAPPPDSTTVQPTTTAAEEDPVELEEELKVSTGINISSKASSPRAKKAVAAAQRGKRTPQPTTVSNEVEPKGDVDEVVAETDKDQPPQRPRATVAFDMDDEEGEAEKECEPTSDAIVGATVAEVDTTEVVDPVPPPPDLLAILKSISTTCLASSCDALLEKELAYTSSSSSCIGVKNTTTTTTSPPKSSPVKGGGGGSRRYASTHHNTDVLSSLRQAIRTTLTRQGEGGSVEDRGVMEGLLANDDALLAATSRWLKDISTSAPISIPTSITRSQNDQPISTSSSSSNAAPYTPSPALISTITSCKPPMRVFVPVRRRKYHNKIPSPQEYFTHVLPGVRDLDSALKYAEERDAEYYEHVRNEEEVNGSGGGIDYTALWGSKVPPKPSDAEEDDKPSSSAPSKQPASKPQPKRRGKAAASKVVAVASVTASADIVEEDHLSHSAITALLSSVRDQLSSSSSASGVSSLLNLAFESNAGGGGVMPQVSPLWLAHRQLPIHSVTPLVYMRDDFEAAMKAASSSTVADPSVGGDTNGGGGGV